MLIHWYREELNRYRLLASSSMGTQGAEEDPEKLTAHGPKLLQARPC